MRSVIRWLLIALAVYGTAGAGASMHEKPGGIALVELFTSEGCSSCPPADELLARLVAEAEQSGRAVYGLSFHVDYWDGLGWKDRFSDPAFTRRQQHYVAALGVRGPYTPQMVVNGTDEFVGSDRARADRSISAALAVSAPVTVEVQGERDERHVSANWRTAGAVPGYQLHVAWVQAEAVSNPERGENAARRLRHVQVVREFRTVALGPPFTGRITLTPPDGQAGSIVAFVQNPKTGRIVGAATATVTEPSR